MTEQASLLWKALEFRAPPMLRAIEPLTDDQFYWAPPNGANSISWLLWHIAEVEDNWVRDKLYRQPRRFPFGRSVRDAKGDAFPGKTALLQYFHEVRSLSRDRLEAASDDRLRELVHDEHFGQLTVAGVWAGVATSCAWHGGQIVMLANRFVPR